MIYLLNYTVTSNRYTCSAIEVREIQA